RHHLEFVLRGHGRLQHHAIKKQKPRTWRGFVSNLARPRARFCFGRISPWSNQTAPRQCNLVAIFIEFLLSKKVAMQENPVESGILVVL
ncbi:hypothetical protein, partial [Burkholderia pseudomallei]